MTITTAGTETFRSELAGMIAALSDDAAMRSGQRAALGQLADYIGGLALDDHQLARLIRASDKESVHGLGWDPPGAVGHVSGLLQRYARTPDLDALPVTGPSAGLDMLADAAERDAADRAADKREHSG